MHVMLKCRCPKLHLVEIRHKLKSHEVTSKYVNKDLLEEKIPGFCGQCQESTVLRVEGMTEISTIKKEVYRGILPDRDDYLR